MVSFSLPFCLMTRVALLHVVHKDILKVSKYSIVTCVIAHRIFICHQDLLCCDLWMIWWFAAHHKSMQTRHKSAINTVQLAKNGHRPDCLCNLPFASCYIKRNKNNSWDPYFILHQWDKNVPQHSVWWDLSKAPWLCVWHASNWLCFKLSHFTLVWIYEMKN